MMPFVVATAVMVGEFAASTSDISGSRAFANPKSSTFITPSSVTLMSQA